MTHALFSPSASHRWLNCPASIKASMFYPDSTNESAIRGTVIHQMGEDALNGIDTVLERDNIEIGKGCEPYPVDQITNDMIAYGEDYADYVRSLQGKNGELWVELKTDLTDLDDDMYGHSDAVVYDPNKKELHVIDLKTGVGMVDAMDNTQLKLYAWGALKMVKEKGYAVNMITLHIYQRDNIHDWTLTPNDLEKWINDVVKPAITDAKSVHPTFNPSTKTCQWCKARNECRPYAQSVLDEFEVIGDDINPDSPMKKDRKKEIVKGIYNKMLLDDKIKFIKTHEAVSKIIDEYRDAVIKQIQKEHNGVYNGYKTVVSHGYPKWVDPDNIANLLKNEFKLNEDLIYKKDVKSPSAIKSIIKEKADELGLTYDEFIEQIDQYTHRAPSNVLLVPETSKRELTTKSLSTLVNEHYQNLKPIKDEFDDITEQNSIKKLKDDSKEVDDLFD